MSKSELNSLAQLMAGLTREELAERLSVSADILPQMSQQNDFSQWSQKLDPEGVSWQEIKNHRYLPNLSFGRDRSEEKP